MYSEGCEARLGSEETMSKFEDPVIMSEAVHWFSEQPLTFVGETKMLANLRALGGVRSQPRLWP